MRTLVGTLFLTIALTGVLPRTGHAASETVVPMDLSGRRAMVDVVINGQGPYTFVVASSFTDVQIERALAVELGLIPDTPSEESVWDLPAVDVVLDHLSLGELTFDAVTAKAYGEEMSFLGKDPRGSLGLVLFREFLVTYDLAGGEFRVGVGTLDEPNGQDILAYTMQSLEDATEPEMVPAIPARIAGKEMTLGLHTGAIGSLQFNSMLLEELPLSGKPGRIGRIGTDKGEADLLGSSLAGTLQFAGQAIENPPAFFSDLYSNPALGTGGLESFSLTIDQSNHRLKLTKDTARLGTILESAAHLQNLAGEDIDLRDAFNADPAKIRMILILSPT